MNRTSAFTLAELLIALAILGVIATFTIPKVLQSQQNGRYNSIAKEAAGTISAAYQSYQLKNALTAGTLPSDLTPFMNYVRASSLASDTIDDYNQAGSTDCSVRPCLFLHNGAALQYSNGTGFGGTGITNAIIFLVDPDGSYSGTTNSPGKAVQFWLYTNGRLATRNTIDNGTYAGGSSYGPTNNRDPSWFSWN